MTTTRRWIATTVAACLLGTTCLQTAQATMIGTEQVASVQQQAPATDGRARLYAALDRADVVAGLEARGVDPAAARARVAALTDAEAEQVAAQIDSAPAGSADVLGVILLIFFVLLLTDILGFTKIFPFTRPIR